MPRIARERSSIQVYHVILRGVNKQQIFECADDYLYFVRILQRQCGIAREPEMAERRCYVYAYCLMSNHVHLLVKELDEPIGDVVKRISSAYVFYYNHKYGRIGHLFQERFKSQAVEDWGYFTTLLRYIHQNPLKPHLVDELSDYTWSSWPEYLGGCEAPFCSTEAVLRRIPIEELTQLVNCSLTDEEELGLLDVDTQQRSMMISDQEAWQIIEGLCGAKNTEEFQQMSRPKQKQTLFSAHEEGIGPRVLSRLTGVPYSIVQRATSNTDQVFLLRQRGMVHDADPEEEEYQSYLEAGEWEEYPEY